MPHDKVSFVFIGRNERRKGVYELNKAIRQIQGLDFEFHFIGDIPEAFRIQAPNIHYHGVLKEREAITAVMQQADVLVCPSYSEGMPNVILEGMASGCAIIASDVGAVNIQVDTSNGWLIKPGYVSELKEALKNAIGMPKEKLLKMRKDSIEKVKDRFLWENVIKLTIFNIKNLINR